MAPDTTADLATTPTPDKYDAAIAYYTAQPARIMRDWNDAFREGASEHAKNMFGACAERPDDHRYGCLTQVKAFFQDAAVPALTNAIRMDPRIPKITSTRNGQITVDDLPVIAEWRRRIDKFFATGVLEEVPGT